MSTEKFFDTKSEEGIFVRYSEESKGYLSSIPSIELHIYVEMRYSAKKNLSKIHLKIKPNPDLETQEKFHILC